MANVTRIVYNMRKLADAYHVKKALANNIRC